MDQWYAVIILGVLGLGVAIIVILRLVSRAANRRERAKRPLDPDSVEALRVARNEGTVVSGKRRW